MTSCSTDQTIGAKPAYINWQVVRGDTSSIVIQFLESNETTAYDTSGWVYVSKAYNSRTNISYDLDVVEVTNGVKITAVPADTSTWGDKQAGKVAELSFDLQVTIDDDIVWTPVLGIISVLGDVPGTLS